MPSRQELQRDARAIGKRIAASLPEGTGFALLVFEFGQTGNLAWISNGERTDMLNALREFIVRVELGQAGER